MIWKIGNYGRLSKDEKGEKLDSKDTQLAFNAQFVKDNNLGIIIDSYFDDDISGVIFNREDLDRLKEDIESKKINMVVCKDLSRLGRSNAKTLTFLEYLEEHQVRLVAINDNYDSIKDTDDIIGIKTWFNERYVADISKKIRSNIHQKLKQGEYLGTPPYGFIKEYKIINNKPIPINKLIVDEKIRPIITEIFDLYIKGNGYRKISDLMEEKGYANPSQLKNYNRPQANRWSKDHIKRIITNSVYCGDTVQGKQERVSFKSKKTRSKPEPMWYITKDTHEAIIPRKTWELANNINKKRAIDKDVRNIKSTHLFSGLIQCGACKKPIVARKIKNKPMGYICSNYFHYGLRKPDKIGGCESHHVNEQELIDFIVSKFKKLFTPEMEEKIKKLLSKEKPTDNKKTISTLQKEIEKFKRQLKVIYQDRLDETISVEEYIENSNDIKRKISSLEVQIYELENQSKPVDELNIYYSLKNEFEDIINQNKINRRLLEMSINKIYIFNAGDIKDIDKNEWMEILDTDIQTINTMQINNSSFIRWKFKIFSMGS